MTTLIGMKTASTIDSREAAEMVGKEHNKLLRDIRTYAEYLGEAKIGQSVFFIESNYVNSQNKKQPCYLLTKQGCEMVANKLTGKKGVLFTARYVTKFNEMETQQALPSYMVADPIARAKQWIEEQQQTQLLIEKNAVQEQLIAEYEPKITYLDEILQSKDSMTITQIAADYGMSAIELNRFLAFNDIQRKVGGQWVLCRAQMNKSYTESKTYVIGDHSYVNTKWKQKGRMMIHDLLEKRGYNDLMDEQLTLGSL